MVNFKGNKYLAINTESFQLVVQLPEVQLISSQKAFFYIYKLNQYKSILPVDIINM